MLLFAALSDSMVGAELVRPLFLFPFYGHLVSELFITTHGFLSLSSRLHDYIYKIQYIAPLRVKVTHKHIPSSLKINFVKKQKILIFLFPYKFKN